MNITMDITTAVLINGGGWTGANGIKTGMFLNTNHLEFNKQLKNYIDSLGTYEKLVGKFGIDFTYAKLVVAKLDNSTNSNIVMSLNLYSSTGTILTTLPITLLDNAFGFCNDDKTILFSSSSINALGFTNVGSTYTSTTKVYNPFTKSPEVPIFGVTESMTSWYKAHLLDQKQNTIIQGKFLEFTNKANPTDISKVAIVGGGILASGFKGATSTVDSFRVLTNAKLKPGTYKEALDSALGIKNSMGTYNMFNNVNGYKYVGMFKVIPDATKVEELKNVGDTATGTIASAGGYVLATGKKALMEALGFLFNTQAGLWMMRTSVFMTLSTSTGEIAVNGTEGQILYQRTSTIDVTGMNDPALEKQSDYWDAVNDYYKEKEQEKIDNNEDPEDETPEDTENPVNDVMENIKTLWEKISGLVENAYTNITTKNDILNVEHEEATQLYDNSLSRPEAKQQAYELEYSKQVDESYSDTAGASHDILKGSKANTKVRVRKDIEQHVKDFSDNESYAELNNFAPSEYLHEEQEIIPNSTYEEVEYKIMALAMELISGTITKAEYETKLNELR